MTSTDNKVCKISNSLMNCQNFINMNLSFYSHIYKCFGTRQYMPDGLTTNAQITTTANMPDGLATSNLL